MKFKINILYDFHEGAWGGGNQFLKALKKSFIKKGIYECNPENADCILINSHHHIRKALLLKLKNQDKIFIHRIDGPIYLGRGKNLKIDFEIFELNHLIADGTIFQSEWSKMKNYSLGLKKTSFEKVIMNASDPMIFLPNNKMRFEPKRKSKVKLISVSWSKNYNKGFDLYQYLDNHLDFNHYTMIFIGNSPIKFINIKHIEIVPPKVLAQYLHESDIYISGSKYEACSNTLIEALTCGLPSVVLNIGSNKEILKSGGELFSRFEDCIEKIQLIEKNYEKYRNNIQIPGIGQISNQYFNFIYNIYRLSSTKKYRNKKLKKIDYYGIKFKYFISFFFRLTKLVLSSSPFENRSIKKIIRKSRRSISIL